jgi:hypothetical protein
MAGILETVSDQLDIINKYPDWLSFVERLQELASLSRAPRQRGVWANLGMNSAGTMTTFSRLIRPF